VLWVLLLLLPIGAAVEVAVKGLPLPPTLLLHLAALWRCLLLLLRHQEVMHLGLLPLLLLLLLKLMLLLLVLLHLAALWRCLLLTTHWGQPARYSTTSLNQRQQQHQQHCWQHSTPKQQQEQHLVVLLLVCVSLHLLLLLLPLPLLLFSRRSQTA
jgi:hypothetical protein